MKIIIKQNILMEHLNYVIKGISSKNLRPILNCIKFELTDEGLYLSSTDNEIAIRTFIDNKFILDISAIMSAFAAGCIFMVATGSISIMDILKMAGLENSWLITKLRAFYPKRSR